MFVMFIHSLNVSGKVQRNYNDIISEIISQYSSDNIKTNIGSIYYQREFKIDIPSMSQMRCVIYGWPTHVPFNSSALLRNKFNLVS